jgi:hypothetical protein
VCHFLLTEENGERIKDKEWLRKEEGEDDDDDRNACLSRGHLANLYVC